MGRRRIDSSRVKTRRALSRAPLAICAGTCGSLIATAFATATPIVNAESHGAVTDATLVQPLAYTVLAPICTVLDALTLLSLRQHAAVFAMMLLCFLAWRVIRARRRGTSPVRELGVALAALLIWIVIYVGGAVIPRPMAALQMQNRDDVVVDFHSHTNHSWDGRRWFTAERNRAWHTSAGFGAAYVSDHKTITGALAGLSANAQRDAGETVLLPAIELRDQHEHIVAVGIDTRAAIDANGEWHDPAATPLDHGARAPLLVLTIPGNVRALPQNEVNGVARVRAVELSDGAPKGINMVQHDERAILHLADSLNLAVVAGSDNHGWGSTAVGWTVMHIPGWRALSPAQLDAAIQNTIRGEGRHAARVYLRDSPNPGRSTVSLASTAPLLVWRTLVDLDWAERVSWAGWTLVIASIAITLSSRAARVKTPPAARTSPATA